MEKQETSEALEAFRRYAQAFQSLDARAVAQHFHAPALMITPHGVVSLPTAAAVEKEYARVMAELPALGYSRTEFAQLAERRLSNDLALLTGSGAWKKDSGEEIDRFGMTYTLRRDGETWRIVVAVIHDPEGPR